MRASSVATAAFLLNTVLWASFYSVARGALSRIDPFVFSCLETNALLPCALVLLWFKRRQMNGRTIRAGLVVGAALSFAVLTSTLALKFTTATNTAFFTSLSGLLAAGIDALALRRTVLRGSWLAGLFSLAGTALLVGNAPSAAVRLGDGLALVAACCYTGYLFVVEAHERVVGESPWILFAVELCTMALVSIVAAFTLGHWRTIDWHWPADAWRIGYVAIATTFAPTAISIFFQRYASPVRVAFIYILEPIWGFGIAHWYLGETLGVAGGVGASLIVLGALINMALNDSDPAQPVDPSG